jgi:citrate synthase
MIDALTCSAVQACSYSSSSEPTLKETFERVLPAKRELLKKVKAQADKKLGEVKVENALGGMRYAQSRSHLQHQLTQSQRLEGHGLGRLGP